MKKWFKKYFIPHKENDFKPHLFREAGVLGLLSLVIVAFVAVLSNRVILVRTNLTALVLPKVLVDYANEDRATSNYRQLAINSTLERAAQLKANDMAEKSYFAHTSPEGRNPWYWFRQVGYDFSYAGENLAVNFDDSSQVNQAWMNSPGHRANIMNENFTEIGIATAEGVYQGRHTVFVVELFGTPAEQEVVLPVVKPTTTVKPPKTTVSKPATTTQVVLAESTSTNELFIAVGKKSANSTNTPTSKYSSAWQKILTNPDESLSFIYFILSFIIVLGLILMIFIEIKLQHPRMIFLGIGLLVIILGLLYIYQSILFAPLLIA